MNSSESGNPIPPEEGLPLEQQRTAQLEDENRRMREHVVFVDIQNPEMSKTLETAAESIRNFISNIKQLIVVVEGLAYDGFSARIPEANHIANMVDGFSTGNLEDVILALDKAKESGIMTERFASFLGYGKTIADPKELKKTLSRILYEQCILRSYDKFLIALETFKNLDDIVNLDSDNQTKYTKAQKEVRDKLNEANRILSEMGITPVSINFFTQVDERTSPYVKYTSIRPQVSEFYPNSSVANQPDLILGATSWAYLKPDRGLWQGHKAELIVSK